MPAQSDCPPPAPADSAGRPVLRVVARLAGPLTGRAPVDLNVIASAVQAVRDIFDLMAKETPEHWRTIAARLDAVPTALEQYASALSWSADQDQVPPRRQVEKVAEQSANTPSAPVHTYAPAKKPGLRGLFGR